MSSRHYFVLVLLVTLGAALRLTYLLSAVHSPGFVWQDPDRYIGQAMHLVRRGEWHWTFNAVMYSFGGQRHALPPGYPIFLSWFLRFPGFPLTALVAQAVLATGSIGLVFSLGRRIHSPTAGLLAAGAYAVWVPNIFNVWSTSQETVYVPLVLLTFVLLARAMDRDSGPMAFAAAGLACGVAALTRSMPMFFVLPAAAAHVALAPARRRASLQACAFAAGVLVVTAPYSVALSRFLGTVAIIDTHGSIHIDSSGDIQTPGLATTAGALAVAVRANPLEYARQCWVRTKSILHVNGGRILQIYVVAGDRLRATIWKCLVHIGADALLLVAVLLGPVGAALCRRPRIAAMLVLWTAVNITVAVLGGFGGARLRTPFEPTLFVLAAAACAGPWQHTRPLALGAALAASCLAAFATLPQLRTSLAAWPDYGVQWPAIFSRQTGQFVGKAGLNVPAAGGVARVGVLPGPDTPLLLEVRANGAHVRTVQLSPAMTTVIPTEWRGSGLAFIELEVVQPRTAAVVRLDVSR
jgi:4-amino-4-deoxy-L-arabinose transferase-like glycosyltransferase